MSNQESIQALFKTGEEGNITLAFTIIEGGAITPLEVMPNLHEQYDFLLKYGQVSEVESDIEKLYVLVSLEKLDLSDRNLTTIPSFNLPNLKELWLNRNKLTTVPSFNLPNLKYLRLHRNALTTIPSFDLYNLEFLNLSANQLTTIPSFNLPSLVWLSLSYNELTTIPSLADLPNLEYLFVRQNELTAPYSHPTAKVFNSHY